MKFSSQFVWLLLCIASVSSRLALAHAEIKPVENLRACLLQLRTSQAWQQIEELRKECIVLARPLADDPSISGRSLYLQTLQLGQTSSTLASYMDLFTQIDRYFTGHLQSDLAPGKLAAFSPTELEDALNGAGQEVFYSSLTQIVPIALKETSSIFAEMERRHVSTLDDARNLYGMYLMSSDYRSADNLTSSWSQLLHPPQIVGSDQIKTGELNYLTLSADKMTLAPSQLHMTGPKILVFGDCHFAYDAFERLSEVSGLQDVMKAHGLVISGSGDIDPDLIDSLRKQYPAFEMHPIYQVGLWFQKGVDVVESPSFAFMVDGVTKFAIPGDATNIAELFCQGLTQIGLERPAGCKGSQ